MKLRAVQEVPVATFFCVIQKTVWGMFYLFSTQADKILVIIIKTICIWYRKKTGVIFAITFFLSIWCKTTPFSGLKNLVFYMECHIYVFCKLYNGHFNRFLCTLQRNMYRRRIYRAPFVLLYNFVKF